MKNALRGINVIDIRPQILNTSLTLHLLCQMAEKNAMNFGITGGANENNKTALAL
jgi:predicted amino acid-binding ACT domain protein